MRRTLITLFSLISLTFAEDIEVVETVLLQDNSEGICYFPSFTQDGESVLFTRPGYTGLWSYHIAKNNLHQLTATTGAGYEPRSLADGTIIYRQDEYVNRLKYSSYIKLNPDTKEEVVLSKPGRFVSPPFVSKGTLFFLENEQLKTKTFEIANSLTKSIVDIALLTNNLKIQLLQNGILSTLSPRGEGNYIWAELSPQKDRILFTKTGEGTYICDLQGNILLDLGYAHASKWSPDGKHIVYMKDIDDGVSYTGSEIWIHSATNKQSWQITDTPEVIEMYPQWSPDNLHIVYHSDAGEIIQTEIKIVD